MARESFRKTKHKSPKFKDFDDGDFDWQDRLEAQDLRRKAKHKQKRKINTEKW